MKVAVQYSGFLRCIQTTYSQLKQYITANEPIEFYIFVHTWDTSKKEEIEYLKTHIKPHRYYIDSQKKFERHPYTFINADTTEEEYKNNILRLEYNKKNPNDIKHFFEVPSKKNNFLFNQNLEVVKMFTYSHFPFNTLSMFYSMHNVSLLTNSYAQENNINFDYIIRMRSDIQLLSPINLSLVPNDKITLFEASNHGGPFSGYTIHDQFAIGNLQNMNIYNDLFIYLPCYYYIFKLDWISEILLGFHLDYNKILVNKIPRLYSLLRYSTRNLTGRPTE